MKRREHKPQQVKFLLRRGPWICSGCGRWVKDEPASMDPLVLKTYTQFCRQCNKPNFKPKLKAKHA